MTDAIFKQYRSIRTLSYLNNLLDWDMNVNLLSGGYETRGEQMALLALLEQQMYNLPVFGDDLDIALAETTDPFTLGSLKHIQFKCDTIRKTPASIITERAKLSSVLTGLWEEAKVSGDDKAYLKSLEKMFELAVDYADCKGEFENRYDALLDDFDRGMTFSQISPIFDEISKKSIEILGNSRKKTYSIRLSKNVQMQISQKLIEYLGFPTGTLSLHESTHPFTAATGFHDVRITTSYDEDDFLSSFYSTLHEAGHAMYELGVQDTIGEVPAADIVSLSLHESQSRFYENIIGRSRKFIGTVFPMIKECAGDELGDISSDDLYNLVNSVYPTPIRVESDEVHYNLHIIVRTQIEEMLINKKAKVSDINELWNSLYNDVLGIKVTDKRHGYLQDIHWAGGGIGYFPTYTLGNCIAAQFADEIEKKTEDFDVHSVQAWFKENLYTKGNFLTSNEIIRSTTGGSISSEPLIRRLLWRYGNSQSGC